MNNRAKQEKTQAQSLRDKLDSTLAQRVRLTLHTPGAKINSLEALMILDGFNTVDSLSLMDMARMRHKVAYEIEQLELLEVEEKEKQDCQNQICTELEEKKMALRESKQMAKEAAETEAKARAALEEAIGRVASMKLDVMMATKTVTTSEEERSRNDYSLSILKSNVEKRQEIVRQALRRKAEEVTRETQKMGGGKGTDIMSIVGDFGPLNARDATKKITAFKEEEHMLRIESARFDAKAERLLSRSQKLKDRAGTLEKDELVAMEELKEELKEEAEDLKEELKEEARAAAKYSNPEESSESVNKHPPSSNMANNFNPTENQSQKEISQKVPQGSNQLQNDKRKTMKKLGFDKGPDGRVI